jgi:hypothetical protein
VNINNAIEAPTATNIAAECVDLSTITNPFCAAVTRTNKPFTGQKDGQITNVTAQEVNVATFFTQGVDFTAAYHANLDDWLGGHYGLLDLHLLGSHMDVFETTPLPGQAPQKSENMGFGGFDGGPTPYWQLNLDTLWTYDAWQVDYDVQWYNGILNSFFGGVSRQIIYQEPNVLPRNLLHTPPQDLHSIQVSYNFADGWQAYAGINNLWYQKPAFAELAPDFPVNPVGRVFYAGLKVDLNP